MARVDMREVANKSGATYDETDTDRIFAEDINTIKDAIDDAEAGINTEQVEIDGTTVIDSSGDIQDGTGVTVHKDKKTGTNCSGSDGAKNRVLTLSNTNTTQQVIVMVAGAFLAEDTDYTVTHNSSSSTVTFLNNLKNSMKIEVLYWS